MSRRSKNRAKKNSPRNTNNTNINNTQKKQGKNMFLNNWTSSAAASAIPEMATISNAWEYEIPGGNEKAIPRDTLDQNLVHVLYLEQETLNEISNICSPIAGSSEFQVHYWGFQQHYLLPDGKKLVFTIPTHFFNFKQTVNPVLVSYFLPDVTEVSEQVKPVAIEAIVGKTVNGTKGPGFLDHWDNNKILALLPEGTIAEREIKLGEFGGIHKHPARIDFSETDRRKNPDNPGVIYRWLDTKEAGLIVTDSIMYIEGPGHPTEIFTTEVRNVHVKEAPNGIEGTYALGKNITIVAQPEVDSKIEYLSKQKHLNMSTELINDIGTILSDFIKASNLKPLLAIDPKNIIQQYASRTQQYGGNQTNFDNEDNFDYGAYKYGVPSKSTNKLVVRATHLKEATLRKILLLKILLRKEDKKEIFYKLNDLKAAGITGNLDKKDLANLLTIIETTYYLFGTGDKESGSRNFWKKAVIGLGYKETDFDSWITENDPKNIKNISTEPEETTIDYEFMFSDIPNKVKDALAYFDIKLSAGSKQHILNLVNNPKEIGIISLALVNEGWEKEKVKGFMVNFYNEILIDKVLEQL